MIRSLSSSLPTYKSMHFGPGLNLVVATKHTKATDKDTRNSAGKTCLVEVIHFLLGANAKADSMFCNPPLAAHSFTMEFDLGGAPATVTRRGNNPNTVTLIWNPQEPWRSRYPSESLFSEREYDIESWRNILGNVTFGLELPDDNKFSPTYRLLIGYFARRERAGGFIDWKRNQERMQPWQQHIAISYLLGFDWEIARRLKELNEYEEGIKKLKIQSLGPTLGTLIGEPGELRTHIALVGERVRLLEQSLKTFLIHDEYEKYEKEANDITRQIEDISNDDVIDRQLSSDLSASLEVEQAPRVEDLERLYEEAGIVLPGVALKRYEEVRRFHDSVIQNRKRHLERELVEARGRVAKRALEKRRLDERKAKIMTVLQAHGALEQRDAMQAEYARVCAELEALKLRLKKAEEIAGKQSEVKRTRLNLQEDWRHDVQDNGRLIERAVLTFQNISSMLYKEYGQFQVRENLGDKGKTFPFEVRRHGDDGKGIRNMLIFSFDMLLAVFGQSNTKTPGFLVHDSHIFDGADERQVGHALYAGAKLAEEHNFQYIVTMNSDAFPTTRPEGFALESCVNPVKLTDKEDDGGLFGIRFDRPEKDQPSEI